MLLATNSLVLHHRSPWRAYYYAALHAFVHYVPIWRSSRDDLLRLVEWLGRHDELAERIAANGQAFACEHLTSSGRLCYWQKAIEQYAAFLDYTPSLARRPRAFPLARLNLMCRIRDAPVVCYYNVHPPRGGRLVFMGSVTGAVTPAFMGMDAARAIETVAGATSARMGIEHRRRGARRSGTGVVARLPELAAL